MLQVVPFLDFGAPGIPGYAQGCNNQHLVNLEAVKQQIRNGGQGDAGLAKAHIQQDCCERMGFDVVNGVFLILMWFVLHRGFLQSVRDHPERKPGSRAVLIVGAWQPAKVAAPCLEP